MVKVLHYFSGQSETKGDIWTLGSLILLVESVYSRLSVTCFKDWTGGVLKLPDVFLPFRLLGSVGVPQGPLYCRFTLHRRVHLRTLSF